MFHSIPENLCIDSFNSQGEINLYSGSHGKSVKNSVPVWSCIGVDHGPNAMKKLNSRLVTGQYKALLGLHVLPYCNDRTVVHDYFPVHNAKSVSDFITRSGMKVIQDWPKKSGDLERDCMETNFQETF